MDQKAEPSHGEKSSNRIEPTTAMPLAQLVQTIRLTTMAIRKLRLLATHPVIALVLVPLSIFFRRYFLLGYFRTGLSGLHDALNIPVYYAWISLYRIRDGLKRKAPAT